MTTDAMNAIINAKQANLSASKLPKSLDLVAVVFIISLLKCSFVYYRNYTKPLGQALTWINVFQVLATALVTLAKFCLIFCSVSQDQDDASGCDAMSLATRSSSI